MKKTRILAALAALAMLCGCSSEAAVKPVDIEAAKIIAFDSAGVSADDVESLTAEYDDSGSKAKYKISFSCGDRDFEYEVEASSGDVLLSKENAGDNEAEAETVTPETANPGSDDETAAPEVTEAPEATDAPDSQPAAPAATQTSEYIGEEAAKKAALEHSGVKEENAKYIKIELDREGGKVIYDVAFDSEGYEYDYDVDALSGEILKSDKEIDDDYVAPSETPTAAEYIDEAEAKKTALDHAGIAEADADWLTVKLDREHGTVVYDVNFNSNGYEYDYEINATTGSIVKSEKEYDDDHHAASTPTSTTSDYIGEAMAKEAALGHAGVAEADADWLTVKLDREHGTVVYDLNFGSNGYEYEYEINAATGKVVKSEKEYDDDYHAASQTASSSDYIGEARAKEIAFDHAGVAEADARKIEVELDREQGTVVYDVSFDSGVYEYDYEIDAVSGAVRKYDKERD